MSFFIILKKVGWTLSTIVVVLMSANVVNFLLEKRPNPFLRKRRRNLKNSLLGNFLNQEFGE
jgi:hypothetical protein